MTELTSKILTKLKMKKLSLEMLKLTLDEVLDRSQMKNILGGAYWKCHCGDYSYFTLMTDNPDPSFETGCAAGSSCTEIVQ
jgi:natural product precursor